MRIASLLHSGLILAVFAALCSATTARAIGPAEKYADDEQFKGSVMDEPEGWRKVAVSESIDLNSLPMDTMKKLCTPFEGNRIATNKCMFDKALLAHLHARDRFTCLDHASRTTKEKNSRKVKLVDDKGVEKIYTLVEEPFTRDAFNQMREQRVQECMSILGWSSANDWQAGRLQ